MLETGNLDGYPKTLERLKRSIRSAIREVVSYALTALSAITPRRKPRGAPKLIQPGDRVGILLQWGLGDAVLALPLLRGIKSACPDAEIHVFGKPWLAELFDGERLIDAAHALVPPWTRHTGKYRIWDSQWYRFVHDIRALRSIRLDWAISPRLDPRDSLQLRLIGARRTVSVSAGGRFWLTDPVPGIDKEYYFSHHRATVAAHIATFLTGAKVSDTPALQGGDRSQATIAKWLAEEGLAGHAVVVVHMGAGQRIREWGMNNFRAALLEACNERRNAVAVVVVDDPNTEAQDLITDLRAAGLSASLWRGSLPDLKVLMALSAVLLCNDSGPMHIAAACGCNVVAIFGPGSLEMFSPKGYGRCETVFHSPMTCRPCYDRCIYQSPICLKAVATTSAAAALSKCLKST